jgi:hypothetical protein
MALLLLTHENKKRHGAVDESTGAMLLLGCGSYTAIAADVDAAACTAASRASVAKCVDAGSSIAACVVAGAGALSSPAATCWLASSGGTSPAVAACCPRSVWALLTLASWGLCAPNVPRAGPPLPCGTATPSARGLRMLPLSMLAAAAAASPPLPPLLGSSGSCIDAP